MKDEEVGFAGQAGWGQYPAGVSFEGAVALAVAGGWPVVIHQAGGMGNL